MTKTQNGDEKTTKKKVALTDVKCRNAKPDPDKAENWISDGATPGLFLVVSRSGSKLWRYRGLLNGKAIMLSIGSYPEWGLQEARVEAGKYKAECKAGRHPKEAERQRKARDKTVKDVALEWHVWAGKDWTPGHARRVLRRLEMYAFPDLGDIRMAELAPMQVLDCLRRMEASGALETTGRIREYLGRICAYALTHRLADQNAVTALGHKVVQTHRTTNRPSITNPGEFTEMMDKIRAYHGREQTKKALILLATLMCRPGELRRMEWSELDFTSKMWRIAPEKMKMNRAHLVPLPPLAIRILRSLPRNGRYIFPGVGRSEIMSENTLNYALHGLGLKGIHCSHGFRASASTILHERGWRSEWIESQLAHADENSVRASYNHAAYLDDRRKMLRVWELFVHGKMTLPLSLRELDKARGRNEARAELRAKIAAGVVDIRSARTA